VQPLHAGIVEVLSNFVVYRYRHHQVHQYVGAYTHHLRMGNAGGPRIQSKTAVLDLESLRDVGKVSIIL
jgi:3-phenylpropionate/cinnamic acid dioxygenase small subunit